jgi:hypothetical protein
VNGGRILRLRTIVGRLVYGGVELLADLQTWAATPPLAVQPETAGTGEIDGRLVLAVRAAHKHYAGCFGVGGTIKLDFARTS